MRRALLVVTATFLLVLETGCGGNTPGQHSGADGALDSRVERDLVEEPEADVGDASEVEPDDADDATDTDATDHLTDDSGDDANADPDGTIIGPVDCETLTDCALGATGWCEGNLFATCGLLDDTCQKVATNCGRGFTCASLTAECLDGRPGGDRCEGAVPISLGSFSLTSVSYRNRYDEYDGRCPLTTNVLGPDRVFVLSPPAEATWSVSVQGQLQVDVVLALVSSCGDVVSSCDQVADEGQGGTVETVTAEGGESGATWYLIVDGRGTFDYGPFVLTISEL